MWRRKKKRVRYDFDRQPDIVFEDVVRSSGLRPDTSLERLEEISRMPEYQRAVKIIMEFAQEQYERTYMRSKDADVTVDGRLDDH